MPERSFFAAAPDQEKLIRFFLERGCWFAPDRHYDSRQYDVLRAYEEIRNAQRQVNWFYVGREDFCTEPLEMNLIDDGPTTRPENAGKYYVVSRTGGATLSLALGRLPALVEADHKYGTGSVHYYPYYWLPDLSATFDAPGPLITLYRDVTKYVKQHSRTLIVAKGAYCVLDGMVAELEKGSSLVLSNWEDPQKVLGALSPSDVKSARGVR